VQPQSTFGMTAAVPNPGQFIEALANF
jgi:hypothetical protein